MPEKETKEPTPVWIKALTWLFRLICGGLFIFSGFVKAIDPWGTIFKVQEYLALLDFMVPPPLMTLFVFALCAVEFIVGCFLMMGCYRKTCPWFGLLIMFFMLPLTLWVAIKNPVADCGCFGDAWVVSNWFTFIKNLILTGCLGWLTVYNLKCISLITPAFQWLAVVASGIFVLIIELIGFYYQPLLDFRPYPEGGTLYANVDDSNPEPELLFVYEKNGKKEEFDLDNLPDEEDGWKFVERHEVKTKEYKPSTDTHEGLHVFDIDSEEELTDLLSDHEGKELLVMIPNVKAVSPATTWKLNSLYEWSLENDVRMTGIVAGNREDIDEWEDLSMASYPVYLAEDTVIKEIVRGNPGIVFMENGKIKWKSSLSAINVDDFMSPDFEGERAIFDRDNSRVLLNCVSVYLIVMSFLIFISFTPRMARLMTAGGLASRRGVIHHDGEEKTEGKTENPRQEKTNSEPGQEEKDKDPEEPLS